MQRITGKEDSEQLKELIQQVDERGRGFQTEDLERINTILSAKQPHDADTNQSAEYLSDNNDLFIPLDKNWPE